MIGYMGKIGGCVIADSAITVTVEYFHMSTIASKREARCVITAFYSDFSQVNNHTSSVFLKRTGSDLTGVMYRNPRPANIYHISVNVMIPMSDLSVTFKDGLPTYVMSYYLPLPQNFQASNLHVTTSNGPVFSPARSAVASSTATDTVATAIFLRLLVLCPII